MGGYDNAEVEFDDDDSIDYDWNLKSNLNESTTFISLIFPMIARGG